VIRKLNGSASTAVALCPSSHERCPLPGRNVKKSLKIFLWVITPLTMATSMNSVAAPTSQRAQMRGMPYSSKWKR